MILLWISKPFLVKNFEIYHISLKNLQMAFPLESSIHCDPGPQGEGLQGSGFSTHLCHACSQTKPLLQSESLVHSGPHPVIVSGLGINPGWQLHMAFPAALTVQVVPWPQGVGTQGLLGCLGYERWTKWWKGNSSERGFLVRLVFVLFLLIEYKEEINEYYSDFEDIISNFWKIKSFSLLSNMVRILKKHSHLWTYEAYLMIPSSNFLNITRSCQVLF